MLNHFRLFTLLIVLVLASFALTDRAAGQGTFGALPDPISSRDLNEYAKRLGLSDQQLLAIGEPHSRYLERFRQLRERDIEQFFDQFREPGRWTRFDPSRLSEFEPIIRDFNRLMNRIRALDDGFFSEMVDFLTPDQAEALPRLRQQRERLRYRSEATRGLDFLNPALRVDLSEMIDALDLPPGELEAIDEYLRSYEQQLTTTSRRVYDSTMKSVLDGLKKVDELGLTEDMLNNPRQIMRMFETFQQIWADVTADLLRDASQLTSLNRRTFRQLGSMMQEDSWRLLREQYLSRAYPEAAPIGRNAESHFMGALEMDGLPDDLRQSIEGLARSHSQSQDRLAEQMVDLVEQRRRNLTLMQITGMGSDSTRSQMDDIRARADAADEAAIETLKAMLGPGLADRLRPMQTATVRRDRISVMRGPGGRPGQRGREVSIGMQMGGGMHRPAQNFLTEVKPPERISSEDLQGFISRLNLSENQAILLDSLHQDYLGRFEAIRREHAVPYVQVVDRVRRQGDRRRNAGAQAELLDEGFELLDSLLQAIAEAEDRFFDDVKVAVIDADNEMHQSALLSMRSSRERSRYRVPVDVTTDLPVMAFAGSGGEARVDVAGIVSGMSFDSGQWRQVTPVLRRYEAEATELFRQRFESQLATHRQSIQFAMARDGDDRQARGARFREMGDQMRQVREAARETDRALADVNRGALVELLDRLPDDAAIQLQDSYYRQAFPEAFHDPDSAEKRIEMALALRNLTESQRSRILEVAADYRPRYVELTYQILDHHIEMAEAPAWRGQQGRQGQRGGGREAAAGAFTERMERMSSLEVLNFDRTELNEQTWRRLRTVLTPDQIALLPLD